VSALALLAGLPTPPHAPDFGGLLGHRIAIGSVFEIHILIAGAVSGATQLGPITEWLGYLRKSERYDRLAHAMAKFTIYYFAIGTFFATLLISVLLVILWGRLWTIVTSITFWPFVIEAVTFLLQVAGAYLWYYTWDRMRPYKPLHIAIGLFLAIDSFVQVLMIDIVASYMLTPTQPGDPIQVFLNPTEVPLQIHRIVGNLAYVGFGIAAVAGFLHLRTKDPLRRAFLDWAGSYGLLWGIGMTLLQPAVGYEYAKEIQLHAYGAWYKMMWGDLSPEFLLQIFILGLLFLVPNVYFQRRLARAHARGAGVLRLLTILLVVTTVFAVLPYHMAFTFDQVQAEGLNRPFWQGGLINPFAAMIPYKIAALTAFVVFSLIGLHVYTRGLPKIDWGGAARLSEQGMLLISLVLVSTMIVLMGFIRENSRFPYGIAGQVQLQGQQSAPQSTLTDQGLSAFP
jgi:cytochrome d ubiquinol oxidase subunit I